MRLQKALKILTLLVLCYVNLAWAAEDDALKVRSAHFGFLHPEGVDVAGYSVEKKFSQNVYSFYTFGYPALAATGFSYYEQYSGNGLTATAGIGIGFVLYASLGYQWQIGQQHYLKAGAGLATGIAYEGAFPVLSYEYRFSQ